MNKVFYILLFLISIKSYSQEFKLKEVDLDFLNNVISTTYDPIIYTYLIKNYESYFENDSLKYNEEGNNDTCAFERKFINGIKYSFNNCYEGQGISEIVIFPSNDVKNLHVWIEKIFEVEASGFNSNEWDEAKNNYRPKDGGAGCYYEIKKDKNRTILEVYCGC